MPFMVKMGKANWGEYSKAKIFFLKFCDLLDTVSIWDMEL